MHVSIEADQPHSDIFGVHTLHKCTYVYVHIVNNTEGLPLHYVDFE